MNFSMISLNVNIHKSVKIAEFPLCLCVSLSLSLGPIPVPLSLFSPLSRLTFPRISSRAFLWALLVSGLCLDPFFGIHVSHCPSPALSLFPSVPLSLSVLLFLCSPLSPFTLPWLYLPVPLISWASVPLPLPVCPSVPLSACLCVCLCVC